MNLLETFPKHIQERLLALDFDYREGELIKIDSYYKDFDGSMDRNWTYCVVFQYQDTLYEISILQYDNWHDIENDEESAFVRLVKTTYMKEETLWVNAD